MIMRAGGSAGSGAAAAGDKGVLGSLGSGGVALFYKAWDQWGALGNFSPHEISMSDYPSAGSASGSVSSSERRLYRSVEHYYQASKFNHEIEEGRELADQVSDVL